MEAFERPLTEQHQDCIWIWGAKSGCSVGDVMGEAGSADTTEAVSMDSEKRHESAMG